MKMKGDLAMRGARLRVLAAALVVGPALQPGAELILAQELPDARLSAWKMRLATEHGGVWMASNAAYVEEDQGIERFGMQLELHPGGVAGTACLWSERADGTLQVAWQFLQGWDPVRQAGFVYQSHWSGGAGIGYVVVDAASGESELIQDFWWPDGSTFKTRHTEQWEGPDERVSTSETWVVDRWEPRRSYTWLRELGHPSPC